MLNRKHLAAAFASLCLMQTASFAGNLTAPKMDEAVKSYKDRQYAQSLAQFRQLHNSGTCNELIHYYMALCYQGMNQISSARTEYATVMKGRSTALRQNAQYALSQIDRWNRHRSYSGNGPSNWQQMPLMASNRKGGISTTSSGPGGPIKEIIIDMPAPSGGGC